MNMWTILALVGAVIIGVLALIAGRLWYRVHQVTRERERRLREFDEANAQATREQRERTNKSIQILARALHQDELTLTEASIRIAHLLDQLDVDAVVKSEFSAFYQLRERTEHIPILAEWKKLDAKAQRIFDKERLQQESHFYDFVMDASKRIQGRQF